MNLINEASPHFHGKGSTQWIMGMVCLSLLPTLVASVFLYGLATQWIMGMVCLSLLPTLVASVFLYGLGAPLLVLVCVATALVTECACRFCPRSWRPCSCTAWAPRCSCWSASPRRS